MTIFKLFLMLGQLMIFAGGIMTVSFGPALIISGGIMLASLPLWGLENL